MDQAIVILGKVLPVFIMLGLGVLCRKKNVLTRESIVGMKNMVVNITLPAVMFSAFATAEFTASTLRIPLAMFLGCLLALGLGFALCRLLRVGGALAPYVASGFEAGMLGYTLFALLYPGEPNSRFAMIDLGQVLFVFTIYKALLAGRGGLKGVMKEIVSSPVIWAIAAGLIMSATGLYKALGPSGVASILDSVANFAAAPTSAVILLTIGYDLTPGEIHWKKTAGIIAVRILTMAILSIVMLLANRYLLGGIMHSGALILMLILPAPYVLPVFSRRDDERADISSALSALTVLSIALFAVMTAFV